MKTSNICRSRCICSRLWLWVTPQRFYPCFVHLEFQFRSQIVSLEFSKGSLGAGKIGIARHMSDIWWFPKGTAVFKPSLGSILNFRGVQTTTFWVPCCFFRWWKKQPFVHQLPASSMLPSMAACFLHRMWYHPFPQGVGKPPTARKLTMSPKTKPMNAISSFWKVNARRYFLMYLSLNTGQFLTNIRPEGVEDANEYHHITINNKVHGHI